MKIYICSFIINYFNKSFFVGFLFLYSLISYPQGDTCTNPITSIGSISPGTNSCAAIGGLTITDTTNETGVATTPCINFSREKWFSFIVTGGSQNISITAIDDTNRDMGILIYSGSCGALLEEGCANAFDVNSAETETVTLNLNDGGYYIRVIYNSNNNQSLSSLCVSSPAPPCNPPTVTAATNITSSSADINWTAASPIPSNGYEYIVSTSNTTPTGSGTATTLTSININSLSPSTTYYVFVRSDCGSSNYSSWAGPVSFITSSVSGPVNDDPCGAIELTLGATCTNTIGDNTGATDSSNSNIDTPSGCEPVSANYNGADVWFSTVVGSTGAVQVDLTHISTSDFNDGVIAIYTGSCSGALTIVDCDDDSGVGLFEPSEAVYGLTPGETIYIRVWEWGASDEGTFNICVTEVVNPCDSITNITDCGSTTITATIASGTGSLNDSCFNAPGSEVIFSFTPTESGNYSFTQVSTAVGHVNYNYSTSCATGYSCIDDLTGNNQTSDVVSLNAGVTYYFLLDTEDSTGGDVSFTLNCPPPPPECGTTFYDSGGISGNYANNESTTTTIFPDNANEVVSVTFTSFEIESCCDDLYVYDGPDATYPLIGVYSGTTIPGPFTSTDTSGALTFVFESDGSVTYSGWAADVTCISNVGCGTDFFDSGGSSGNYSNNESEITTINPDNSGEFVTVTFSSFNLDSGDTLIVYDGPDTGSPSLGSFSGTTIPGPFTSTDASGSLTFEFTSDGSGVQSGWEAAVTCDCYLTISETSDPVGATSCTLNYAQLVASGGIATPTRTTVFSEDFSSATFPPNWTVDNPTINSQWIIANTATAGGTAFEAVFDWNGGSDVDTWILSTPAIDITGHTNLELDLRHYLSHFSSTYPYSVYIETSLDNSSWTSQFSLVNVSATVTATSLNIDLSSLDGNTTLYIRFRFTGESFGINSWAIDDIVVSADGIPAQITWSPTTGLYTDSALTTPYTGGFTDTVYAAPIGTETYTATDENGCSGTVEITRGGKIWNGSIDEEWNKPGNWTPPGVPTITDCVVIPDTSGNSGNFPLILDGIDAEALNVTILSGANITIENLGSLTVQDFINGPGTVLLQGSEGTTINTGGGGTPSSFNSSTTANLIQINNTAVNTAVVTLQRHVFTRTQDYVYWSSPVAGVNPLTNFGTSLVYEWDPTIYQDADEQYGNWMSPQSASMEAGKGYIARGPSGGTNENADWAMATFTGVPHNGIITQNIRRGTYLSGNPDPDLVEPEDDNWNLVGNPYPSNLDVDLFLQENATHIDGYINLWTHGIQIRPGNSPNFGDYVLNYDEEDYLVYNLGGSTGGGHNATFDGYLGSGQGFFVLMLDGIGTQVPLYPNEFETTIEFNNNMRTDQTEMFFRSAQQSENTSNSPTEKHRIWLDLIQPDYTYQTILVGYIQGATMYNDHFYDAKAGNSKSIYSLISGSEDKFVIQGRALPFEESDIIPLGVKLDQIGEYAINLNNFDGLFEINEQDIFLEDFETGIVHDLRESAYFFTINETGTFNNRFLLRYTNTTLGIDDIVKYEIRIIAPNNEYIKVTSRTNQIETVKVYDLLGRVLIDKQNINASELTINNVPKANGAYIVKARLTNGIEKIQKVVLK